MSTVAIVAGGPKNLIPDLNHYRLAVDYWIGADLGALLLVNAGIKPNLAVGDFDSITPDEKKLVQKVAIQFEEHPVEKDKTDLELAILHAIKQKASRILLFGVTGGRLDHSMASIQLLYRLLKKNIIGIIIDTYNWSELYFPGVHEIVNDSNYTHLSFLPFTKEAVGITLSGFYYPLSNETIDWGSTLCISNKLISKKGTFSFTDGILLVIKSREVLI
ncbi:thiamine diphosphokinase [Aquibacillus salsiterrae]|uniref:Thiamine diphosphokinase n=1 Tax=Aquibacillus salsiterrae TaxID=2950439 RepID=A0A9X4AE67_9BACI|nr:thiamine diphosphokinase [Aquibacillus salsiterrae]MDC3416437.1 thiamine diphosphokinase [Aquibacillus salsiterrae]